MPTPPPPITALPLAPSRDDSVNFSARADAFVAALPPFGTEANALASNVYSNALEAEVDATAAAASEATAGSFAGQSAASALLAAQNTAAPLWVSGTTYAIGAVVYSPLDAAIYRRKTAGAGTTDPSLDSTNWAPAGPPAPPLVSTGLATFTASANTHVLLVGTVQQTLTLPASPAAGDVVTVTVANSRIDSVIARNSTNIMALAEDLTLDSTSASVILRYVGTGPGWRIV
jgi:hypothetical protein